MAKDGKKAWASALDRHMWRPLQRNVARPARRPSGLAERLERIEQEAAIRDLLHSYAYCYDGNDLDGAIAVFHADCVLVNPRGTYVGIEAIGRNYRYLLAARRFSFHHLSNIVVRFAPGGREALSTAYFHVVQIGNAASADAGEGTYVDRLVRQDGWRIIERRITLNVSYAVSVLPEAWPPRPEPSRPEGSRDWIGPAWRR
ncbi:MAG: nuclear transport factor 2 family protein [Alphaproteobacteria bacterium]|nr:nuclear transport factor 2 family protein [Alphaproteobacteria bacterium]